MRPFMRPGIAASPEHGGGSAQGPGGAGTTADAQQQFRSDPPAAARRAPWRAAPLEAKRRALKLIERSFGRIEADFSEAYEQCRNDTHRAALERARLAAKAVQLRARHDDALADRDGWRRAEAEFRAAAARAKEKLATLRTASAVARIAKRLDTIAAQMTVVAA